MTCAAACGFQPQAGSTDSEREKDVYAIYSLMLGNPNTSHGSYDSERLLIAMTTRPAHVQVSCMRPPQERDAEFREVLADYERRKTTPRQVKPLFSIPKPYVLLTDDEVGAFTAERMRPFAQRDDQFRGVSDYFTLSDVYFNQFGTLALTALSSWCGGLCGQTQWRIFEKLATGKWQELRWGLCSAIAENLGFGPDRPSRRPEGRRPAESLAPHDILQGCEHFAFRL
jgi:hypothetical protein